MHGKCWVFVLFVLCVRVRKPSPTPRAFIFRLFRYSPTMERLKTHLKVVLYAVIFGMITYGFVQLGMVVHRQFL